MVDERAGIEEMRVLTEDLVKLKHRRLISAISTSKLTVELKRQIGDDLADLIDSINEQQKIIHYLRGQLDLHKTQEAKSFADVVKMKPVGKRKSFKLGTKEEAHEVEIIPLGKQESEATKNDVKSKIKPEILGIGVERFRKIGKGGVLIRTGQKKDIEALVEEFGKNEDLKTSYEIHAPRKRDPRIIIFDVQEQYEKEEIRELIERQNEEIENIEVIASFKAKKGSNWIFRVKGSTYKEMESLKRIKIGWMCYNWKLYSKPTICYNCWKYGHIGKYCNNLKICKNCSEKEHGQEPCKRGRVCCNCDWFQKRTGQKVDTSHLPTDVRCSRYQIEINRIIERTDYGRGSTDASSSETVDERRRRIQMLMEQEDALFYKSLGC